MVSIGHFAEYTTQQLVDVVVDRIEQEVWSMSQVTLEDIDASLTSLRASIRRVRNARCPINTLPTEILSTIFRHTPIIEYTHTNVRGVFDSGILRRGSVVKVTHVCRFWREIALSMPTLWNRIDDSSPGTQHMFFERSVSAALGIRLIGTPSDFMKTLMLSDSHRFRELHWDVTSTESGRNHATFPVPNLEVLTLRGWGESRNGLLIMSGEPLTVFQGEAPRLRVLSLDKLDYIPSDRFPCLTSLHIRTCFTPTILLGLKHILRYSTLLEDIYLEDFSEEDWDEDEARQLPFMNTLDLAHLDRSRRVVFDNLSASAINWILSCVVLSPQVAIRISCYTHWPYILSIKLLDLLMVNGLTRLSILSDSKDEAVLTAVDSRTGLQLYLTPDPACDGGITSPLKISDFIPTQQIREFWIGLVWNPARPDTPDPLHLRRLLRELSALELLIVRDNCIRPVAEALTPSYCPAEWHGFPCCRLRTLQVIIYCDETAWSVLEVLSVAQLSSVDVVIAYHPRGEHFEPDPEPDDATRLESNLNTVVYKHCAVDPRMELPALCMSTGFEEWSFFKFMDFNLSSPS
ncbi:uncharacterized protein C8Q71DRAFT_758884 [Rhodofomes roseus]|uniref:F-box domain-containing protein n=1 Tax=Rhodofomes roseus TaxID=34475 RepID=A0ABQ8KFS1_9APHY|nr:uncharacterized protein C8Q71DRAFT_758884 [Rhodofomes roseus]KAH9836633.1 hypothetical protein C8Q71DRAFT_758884 [Rhodofomes roseus]